MDRFRIAVGALLLAALPLLFSPCSLAAESASARLAALADGYFDARLQFNPLAATEEAGDPRFEGELAIDISPDERAKEAAAYRDVLKKLTAIDRARLSPGEQLTYDVLKFDAGIRAEALTFPRHLLTLHQLEIAPVKLAGWAGGQSVQPFKTVANYENFLKRIERLVLWNSQAIGNLRAGMSQGWTQPREIAERALEQLKSLAESKVEDSPFYSPVKRFPDTFSEADKARLTGAYREAIVERIQPSLKRLYAFARDEYLPATRTTAGVGAMPKGAAWYKFLVRESTTTAMSADAIHALGLKEVTRIHGEYAKVQAQVGIQGSLGDFLKSLDARADLMPFKTEEDALAAFRAIDAKVLPQLPKLFGRLPKAPMEIRGVDPLLRDTASSNYILPSMDGSRPGVFYAAIPDPAKFSTPGMTALLLHEGQPGHHLHLALQQEMDVPKFRRVLWYDAYGEGWALYAETLGRDMGLYDDPYAYAGRLQLELVRAIRLVVDTGLHAKGWTREQTIRYIMDNQGATEPSARRATERYMAWPGQALAYKVGELKILALRAKAKQALGDRFDIAAFHDTVLGSGSVPLSMLEARVDKWIRENRAHTQKVASAR